MLKRFLTYFFALLKQIIPLDEYLYEPAADDWCVSAWCTSDASSCVLHDLRRQLTSSVRTCMYWVYIVTTLLLFSKVTKPVLGPHLWQPGLSAVSSWVITFRCNIKCPCAFWSLIFHGVSDWRREDKMFVLTCQHTKTLITYSCKETVSCITFFSSFRRMKDMYKARGNKTRAARGWQAVDQRWECWWALKMF